MNLIIIGPGHKPIPPVGWGAVESVIWDYYENLKKKNINVVIINDDNLHRVIYNCNIRKPDIIHIMYDDYITIVPHVRCKKIIYTSHYAKITNKDFEKEEKYYFIKIFKRVIEYQNKIILNSISPLISDVYKKYGYEGKINNICNGAREDLFKYTDEPLLSGKSIYVAKIEIRKCQYKYQTIPDMDFAGNYYNSTFDISNVNYLGEWSKEKLYENLTNYGNLVLLSDAEADPLVVKEALISGLGVVLSECSTANLDLSMNFITVIPNEKLEDLEYIKLKIKENRIISITNRDKIREYALKNFTWNNIIDKYIETSIS